MKLPEIGGFPQFNIRLLYRDGTKREREEHEWNHRTTYTKDIPVTWFQLSVLRSLSPSSLLERVLWLAVNICGVAKYSRKPPRGRFPREQQVKIRTHLKEAKTNWLPDKLDSGKKKKHFLPLLNSIFIARKNSKVSHFSTNIWKNSTQSSEKTPQLNQFNQLILDDWYTLTG